MPRLTVDGEPLACETHGAGEPLVLVHGSASDLRTWRDQTAAFAARFRTILYSRRFHWPNRPIGAGEEYAMPRHVADLAGVLRARADGSAHLVGHSYGAFLCLLLALHAPELVRSLVLVEPPALTLCVSSEPRPGELLRLLVTRPRTAAAIIRFGAGGVAPARRAFARGDAEAGFRIFADAVFGRGGLARLPAGHREQLRDNRGNVRAELMGPGFAPLPPREVRRVRAPVLLVAGGRSIALFHRLLDRLHELLPHAERVLVPGASHLVHEDEPAAFNEAVLAFLDGAVPGTRGRTHLS